MFIFFILGILSLLVGIAFFVFSAGNRSSEDRTSAQIGGTTLVVVAAILCVVSTIRIVGPGKVGVQVFFGKVRPTMLQSGLHLVNPFISVKCMSIRTEVYTMSSTTNEGKVKGDDAIVVLSADNLSVPMDLTVRYHLIPSEAARVYRDIGPNYVSKIIRPTTRTAARNAAVKFKAVDILSTKRAEVALLIAKELTKDFFAKGIELERVQLRNVTPPKKVREAIEAKIAAEQETQRMEFVLQKAKKEAEVRIVEAKGIAEAQRIINQTLTKNYLQHEAIQAYTKLAGSPNTTFVIMPTSPQGAGLPLIIGSK